MARNQANTMAGILVIMALIVVVLPDTKAQSPSPGPAMNPMAPMVDTMGPSLTTPTMGPSPVSDVCLTALLNMSDCLTFVEPDSNLTKPDPACCPELAGLVESSPICLCQLVGDPGQTGFQIDVKKALQLPAVCNVTTPPVSLCAAIGVPVNGLTPAPSPSPSSSSPGDMVPARSAASPPSPSADSGASIASTRQKMFYGLAIIILQALF